MFWRICKGRIEVMERIRQPVIHAGEESEPQFREWSEGEMWIAILRRLVTLNLESKAGEEI